VVIVGAGIAGCATAILLNRLPGVRVSIYDRDQSFSARDQGYSLTIAPNGVSAFRELKLDDQILGNKLQSSGGVSFLNKSGKELCRLFEDSDYKVVQVERGKIREIFHEVLHDECVIVNYDAKCRGFEEGENEITVQFDGATEVKCDLLIGADGTKSAIRQQMNFPNDSVHHFDLISLNFEVPMEHPAAKLFGEGTKLTLGRGLELVSKANYPSMTVALVAIMTKAEVEQKWPNIKDLTAEIKSRFGAQGFFNMSGIEALDMEPTIHYVTDRDPLRPWLTGRAMIIGDACHPAAPFLGQGANLALEDAVGVAAAVKAVLDGEKIEDALQRFELQMLARSAEIIKRSRFVGRLYATSNPILCWARDLFFMMLGFGIQLNAWRNATQKKYL